MQKVFFTISGQQRHAYICNAEKIAKPGPVVLALHGAGGNPFLFRLTSRLDQAMSRHGSTIYLSAQRHGKIPRWQIQDSSDMDFLHQVIHHLRGMGKNAEDIYLVGMSNGGCLAHQFGFLAGIPIGGVASVCAALPRQHHLDLDKVNSSPAHLTPNRVLLVNALLDPIVPFSEETSVLAQGDYLGHYESVALWRSRLEADDASISQSPASSSILSLHDVLYRYYESSERNKRLLSLCVPRKVHAWELLCDNSPLLARDAAPRKGRARMQGISRGIATTSELILQYLFLAPNSEP